LVRVATDLGPQTDRLALRGEVSCAQARRTLRAFLRDANSGACGSGRICGIRQPGGWQCAFLGAVESQRYFTSKERIATEQAGRWRIQRQPEGESIGRPGCGPGWDVWSVIAVLTG
jgi:hypothetical protein